MALAATDWAVSLRVEVVSPQASWQSQPLQLLVGLLKMGSDLRLYLRIIIEPFGLPFHQFARLDFHRMRVSQAYYKYVASSLGHVPLHCRG